MSFTFLKLSSVVGFAGASIISPLVFSQASSRKYPLTLQKLKEFTDSKGFSSCYPFLFEQDKSSLLFVCLENKGLKSEGTSNKENFATHYFFYNNGSWEKAISVRKNPNSENSLLVETEKSSNAGSISNTKKQADNLKAIDLNRACKFQQAQSVQGNHWNKRVIVCSFEDEAKSSNPSLKPLRWSLKEFSSLP